MSNQMDTTIIKHETYEVRFDRFEGLPRRKGDFVESAEFTCYDHKWVIRVYPGGQLSCVDEPGGEEESSDGYVALYLVHKSEEEITASVDLSIRELPQSYSTQPYYTAYQTLKRKNYAPQGTPGYNNRWGFSNFAARSDISGSLKNGALVVEVRMMEVNIESKAFVPEHSLSSIILKKFNDEESSDVVFDVGGEQVIPGRRKKAKMASTVTFHAHSYILESCSPIFAELCKFKSTGVPVSITNVSPDIFRAMLYYLYGGDLSDEDMKDKDFLKDIIDGADKYAVVGLKLKAEAFLVSSTGITVDNVMELLLYADEKNLALLKEATMDFLLKNRGEVRKKVSFDNFPGHLVNDLLMAMDSDSTMSVSALRKKLHEKGLDIDGSREAMLALLEKSSRDEEG